MASLDMTKWMSELPPELTAKPLVNLIIPGSHDSFTKTLDKDGPIANDRPDWFRFIQWLPGIKSIIYRWTLTQHLSTIEQLEQGVRYFDFRLSRPPHDLTAIKVLHGLYGSGIGLIFADIFVYLQQHPRESGYQVIAFYKEDEFVEEHCVLWPSAAIQSPWADTDTPKKLIAYLQEQLMKRSLGDDITFFNTQGILTPQISDAVFHFYSSLETDLATPTTQRLVYWLRDSLPLLKSRYNIVFCDFVEKYDFCRSVVQLNFNSKR
uniref:Uncharacterized protein n=1 Tax=Plectus sambesii TaxID=2011161 RepID=A0A914V4P8_9BILA